MRRVHWGILSTAKIATQKVIPALQKSELCEVLAIASRNQTAADQAAKNLGVPRAYSSYEALLADPDVDVVYVPLPNHLHVPWSIRALEAGKHVLCEKPIGLSSTEGEELLAAAARYPHLKVMEAFMYRHHPQWLKAKQLVQEGEIGTLQAIQAAFSYCNTDSANIRNSLAMGGGGLMDIGCYCISLARFLFDDEPRRVCGLIENDPNYGIDRLVSAILDFDTRQASFICSTQIVPYQRVNAFGTRGRIEIEIPFNAPPDKPCRIWHEKDGERIAIDFPVCDQYTIQGDLLAASILNDTPVTTPLTDAVANMRVIESIKASAVSGQWV